MCDVSCQKAILQNSNLSEIAVQKSSIFGLGYALVHIFSTEMLMAELTQTCWFSLRFQKLQEFIKDLVKFLMMCGGFKIEYPPIERVLFVNFCANDLKTELWL